MPRKLEWQIRDAVRTSSEMKEVLRVLAAIASESARGGGERYVNKTVQEEYFSYWNHVASVLRSASEECFRRF